MLKKISNNEIRRQRKEKLVNILGGCCSRCGYKKSLSALSFHHVNPSEKLFDLSKRGNLSHTWEELLNEARKCVLLCLNCHAEIDNDKER